MKEKYLFLENFVEEGKIFAWGKLPWWRKDICLWKTSLMKEKFLGGGKHFVMGNFPDEEKNAKNNFPVKKIIGLNLKNITFFYFGRNHS